MAKECSDKERTSPTREMGRRELDYKGNKGKRFKLRKRRNQGKGVERKLGRKRAIQSWRSASNGEKNRQIRQSKKMISAPGHGRER